MQFNVHINQVKMIEWGLNLPQAFAFAVVHNLPDWANHQLIDGVVYYAVSKKKFLEEAPGLGDKPDTVYRILKQLEEKGVVSLSTNGKITLVAITKKGKTWNRFPAEKSENNTQNTSEINPTNLGNISEPRKYIRDTSEINPTNLGNISDKSYNHNNKTNNHIDKKINKKTIQPESEKPEQPKPKKPKTALDANWLAENHGVNPQVATDWLTVRKAKRAPLTATAMKLIENESAKAGISVAEAIRFSCEAGWVGFKAEWYENRQIQNANKNYEPRSTKQARTGMAADDVSWMDGMERML